LFHNILLTPCWFGCCISFSIYQGLSIPHVSDFQYLIFLTAGISVLRYFFEKVIFKPLGAVFLKNRPAEVGS
jgi:hypothetical protein